MLGTGFQLQPQQPATGPLHTGLFLPSVSGPQILYGLADYPKDESIALNIWPSISVYVKQHHSGNTLWVWGELGSILSPSLVNVSLGQSALNLLIPGMSALYNMITTVSASKSGFCLLSVDNLEDFINSQEMRLCSTIQAGSSSWSKMTTSGRLLVSCPVCSANHYEFLTVLVESYFIISNSVSTAPGCGLDSRQ